MAERELLTDIVGGLTIGTVVEIFVAVSQADPTNETAVGILVGVPAGPQRYSTGFS